MNDRHREEEIEIPHAIITHALELKPYIEEPLSILAKSFNFISLDLRPRVRHDFILSTREAVDEYWQTLEYCYAAADPKAAVHAFPGSVVHEVSYLSLLFILKTLYLGMLNCFSLTLWYCSPSPTYYQCAIWMLFSALSLYSFNFFLQFSLTQVFLFRSWASARVMTAEQRAELLKRVVRDCTSEKLSFKECEKIAKDLNLTLEQVTISLFAQWRACD